MRQLQAACRVLLVSALGSLTACASAAPAPEWEGPTPMDTYAWGMAALEAGDQERGRAELEAVLDLCGTTALGERAAVALMTDALDPRNPDPDYSAKLSYAYLNQPYRTTWGERVASSVYLVSLNLGAGLDTVDAALHSADPEGFPAECRSDWIAPTPREAAAIPVLETQSLPSRVAQLERAIAELQAELDRVRETLRP